MGESQLTALLSSMKIGSAADVGEMVSLSKNGGHFGLSCQKHFDLTHPGHQAMGLSGSVSAIRIYKCM